MTALEILGAIVGLLVAVGILAFGVGYVLQEARNILDRLMWARLDHGLREAGTRMVSNAYWLSEDARAMNAVRAAGEFFRDNGACYDPEKVRERWRALCVDSEGRDS